MDTSHTEVFPLKSLSRKQRRVLGTLIEKGITTPEQYPLTLKATVTGCNQKNNREPISNYEEDAVYQVLDELREMGLVAFIQTETGRTERYRHYCRQKLSISEPQLAILTELLLRGRQQLGELRTRASRMCAIDSQDELKTQLKGLLDRQWIRANGPLDRRGVEVDHNLYAPGENHEPLAQLADEQPTTSITHKFEPASPSESDRNGTQQVVAAHAPGSVLSRLEESHEEMKSRLSALEAQVSALKDALDDLRRQLGA
ncbi:conserved hypothetical protein [Planctopirus limnophila DSM 3776]|uniref:DUF480 domain-containing protein n=1 Tax=Planctopirus limnophila (strain ATCC 43296 / DSM 3776 / IFAM 1008 / Mu 290) TaxID=521674 RepID=D5SRM5_PLAL2|nr:DUF480 domain-containing protein [Planctopirus limnophila]ADG66559.1 conserved hypothetical protein [Planctopirus limnophila DSM 3776]